MLSFEEEYKLYRIYSNEMEALVNTLSAQLISVSDEQEKAIINAKLDVLEELNTNSLRKYQAFGPTRKMERKLKGLRDKKDR